MVPVFGDILGTMLDLTKAFLRCMLALGGQTSSRVYILGKVLDCGVELLRHHVVSISWAGSSVSRCTLNGAACLRAFSVKSFYFIGK